MHLDNFITQVWTFTGGPATRHRRRLGQARGGHRPSLLHQTRMRENVLLQAKVCQSGNGGPAVNVLAGAMQNSLGQYAATFSGTRQNASREKSRDFVGGALEDGVRAAIVPYPEGAGRYDLRHHGRGGRRAPITRRYGRADQRHDAAACTSVSLSGATVRWGGSAWRSRRTASTWPIRCAARTGTSSTDAIAGVPATARWQRDHRRTRRRRRTVRAADGRRGRGNRRDDGRPGGAAVGLRAGRPGPGAAGRRPVAPGQAGQPGRPLPRDGAVLRRQPDRRGGRGDDDVDRVGAGQPRRRAAGRLGGAGAAGACAWARR